MAIKILVYDGQDSGFARSDSDETIPFLAARATAVTKG